MLEGEQAHSTQHVPQYCGTQSQVPAETDMATPLQNFTVHWIRSSLSPKSFPCKRKFSMQMEKKWQCFSSHHFIMWIGEPEMQGGQQGRFALVLRCSLSDTEERTGPTQRNPDNLANTSAYTIFSQYITLQTSHQLKGLRCVIQTFEQHLALMLRMMLLAH